MNTLKKSLVIFLLSAIFPGISAHAQSIKENSENWQVTSAWVKEVTPEQQTHAIFSAFTALNKKTEELIKYKNEGQGLWVAKIIACGTSMLATVSTKNPDMKNYFQQVSDLHANLIRGETTRNRFVERDEQLRQQAMAIFAKINDNSYKETTIAFKRRLSDTDLSLVSYAMMCATSKVKQPESGN